ncbi:hypothetical protein G9A89_000408 [Geosiphon pyriformis]|nr:hypothetical protein G9A89_000408 [Geosiphon pyriformis]
MEEKCLIEETSFNYGEGGVLAIDNSNQIPTGLKARTMKTLGKLLGKIDFSLNGNDNGIFLNTPLELPLPVKNLVNISVHKFFALDISLNKVTGKSSQEKLAMAVVLKKIPIGTLTKAVHTVLSEFGLIKSIKMQLVGLWQKAVVEFEQINHADLVVAKWSILIGKDAVHVVRFDMDKELWDAQDVYKTLLYTLPIGTNAHNIWDYVALVSGKTCIIDYHLVLYAWAKCATVCFDSAESLDVVIKTMFVLKGANLCWFCLVLAKCAGYEKLGHTSLTCLVGGKKNTFLNSNKSRLVAIYTKHLASVVCPVSFGGVLWAQIAGGSFFSPLLVWNILLKTGSSSKMKPTPLVSLELNNRFATLEYSLASLTECVNMLAKRLDTPEPTVSQLSPKCQPLMTPSSQNQRADIVISESLDVATSDKTVVGVVVFDSTVILKMETTLNNLSITVMSLLAKIDYANSHKKKNNLVSIFIESKLKGKIHLWIVNKFDDVWMFISGLESSYLGAGVVVVMNSFLAKHVCRISELLFKNKLSASILGLYAGVSSVAWFSQTGDINFLIAKAVNKSSFIILGDDFNEDYSCKCASFKKCLDFGLVNALGGSFCEKSPTWFNSQGIVKTIDYVLIFLNLVNAVVGHDVFGIKKYFDIDHQTVSILAKFKNDMAANAVMFYNNFLIARIYLNLDAMWAALCKVLCLSTETVFKKKWFKDYDHVFVEESSKFHKLELLVSKLVKASRLDSFGEFASLLNKWKSLDLVNASVMKFFFLSGFLFNAIWSVLFKIKKLYCSFKMLKVEHIKESRIRLAIDKKIESFELNKGHTIRSVLEHFFHKITLDHLVVDNELVLEPDLVKTKMDHDVVSVVSDIWCCQYQSLEYVFDDAFSGVMCSIDFDEMSGVISNLPNRKKHCDRLVLNMFLVLLNFCLNCKSVSGPWKEAWMSMIPKLYKWEGVLTNTHLIALIEMAHKILFKILSNRIFFVCSKFNVLTGDNFSVLKGITTQSPIFTIGSVVKDALEKNHELWLILVRIKMCEKFIQFFGRIHNSRVNKVITDFELTDGYQVHDSLDQGKMFFPLLWCIFYDPLLCEVKRQESVYGYRLDSCFVTKTGCFESWTGLTFFLTADAFAATQHILNVASEFFWINDISINNNKTVAIPINCRVSDPCLLISDLSISIAKKEESYQYLGIFLSTEKLSKPSLARAYLDVWFFTNLVLRKSVSNKQFSYLVLAVFYLIIAYRIQFSFVSINSLKSKSDLLFNFSNNAIYHPSLYGLKFFEQSASVIGFANSVGILGHLFVHRLYNLQILSWCFCHPLLFSFHININSSDNFLASIIQIFLGTSMSVIFGKPTFYKCVSSLWYYGIAFVEQLCNHTGSIFEWRTFKWWKRLDSWSPVLHWFDVFVRFLNDSGSSSVCNLLLSDVDLSNVFEFHEFEVVCNHLLEIDSSRFFLFMNGSLNGLDTLSMKAGAAVFFEDIDLSLGVRVSELVFSTMAELQAIALALECVLFSHLVNLFLNSQAALNVCKSEFMLTCPDFRNWCWIKCHHITNIIHHKNLDVNWVKVRDHSGVLGNECADTFTKTAAFFDMHLPHIINEHFFRASGNAMSGNSRHFVCGVFQSVYHTYWKIGSSFWVLVDSLHADVNWSRSSLMWHLNFHLTAGFTSTQTAGF